MSYLHVIVCTHVLWERDTTCGLDVLFLFFFPFVFSPLLFLHSLLHVSAAVDVCAHVCECVTFWGVLLVKGHWLTHE